MRALGMMLPAVAILMATTAGAAPPGVRSSQSESGTRQVNELRGFALGGAVKAEQECPKREGQTASYLSEADSAFPRPRVGVTCWRLLVPAVESRAERTLIFINLSPARGLGRDAIVTVVDNRIEGVEVNFNSDTSVSLLAELTAAYGTPAKKRTVDYISTDGARFEGVSATWTGSVGTATFEQYSSSPGTGRATLYANDQQRFAAFDRVPRAATQASTVGKTQ